MSLLETSGKISKNPALTAKEQCKRRCDFENSIKGDLNKQDGYDCPICLNKGGVFMPRLENGYWYEIMIPCECRKKRAMLISLKKNGLKNIVDKTFENYEVANDWQKKIKAAAIDYCENGNGKWFFIGGQSGAGKTHLCNAIVINLLKQGYSIKYILWRDESISLKANVNNNEVYHSLIEPIKNADVLYIDDLFKIVKDNNGKYQQPTCADINLAFEIINYRSINKKAYTIISSECTIEQILSIDEAIGSRILEMATSQFTLSINRDFYKNYRLNHFIK